jgi:hypothetical protein
VPADDPLARRDPQRDLALGIEGKNGQGRGPNERPEGFGGDLECLLREPPIGSAPDDQAEKGLAAHHPRDRENPREEFSAGPREREDLHRVAEYPRLAPCSGPRQPKA